MPSFVCFPWRLNYIPADADTKTMERKSVCKSLDISHCTLLSPWCVGDMYAGLMHCNNLSSVSREWVCSGYNVFCCSWTLWRSPRRRNWHLDWNISVSPGACRFAELHPKSRGILLKHFGGNSHVTLTRMLRSVDCFPLPFLYCSPESPWLGNYRIIQRFLFAEHCHWPDCPNMAECDWLLEAPLCHFWTCVSRGKVSQAFIDKESGMHLQARLYATEYLDLVRWQHISNSILAASANQSLIWLWPSLSGLFPRHLHSWF